MKTPLKHTLSAAYSLGYILFIQNDMSRHFLDYWLISETERTKLNYPNYMRQKKRKKEKRIVYEWRMATDSELLSAAI